MKTVALNANWATARGRRRCWNRNNKPEALNASGRRKWLPDMKKILLLQSCMEPAWIGLLTALAIQWSADTARANVRLEGSGPPAYARIESGLIHNDGEWAAIAFYRSPDCVPDDFNLLDFFNPAALECPSFVAGFEIWKNGPWAGDEAPIQSRLNNTGPMPILFVSWTELQTAIADGVLTVAELKGLSSLLIGAATFYSETLHPSNGPGGGQGAQQTMTSIAASGFLEDGRKFTYQATETKNTLRHVQIEFE